VVVCRQAGAGQEAVPADVLRRLGEALLVARDDLLRVAAMSWKCTFSASGSSSIARSYCSAALPIARRPWHSRR
jgi:hypothetical protein